MMAGGGLNGHRKGRRCVWLAATNGFSLGSGLGTHCSTSRVPARRWSCWADLRWRLMCPFEDTCSQACTIEGSIAEHCKLTFRACHPCSTADPCSCPSRTAAAARARPMTLQTFAKKSAAHLAWRRETMQRSQAAFSDSRASLPAPGPLTDAAAIRSVHPPRRPAVDRG